MAAMSPPKKVVSRNRVHPTEVALQRHQGTHEVLIHSPRKSAAQRQLFVNDVTENPSDDDQDNSEDETAVADASLQLDKNHDEDDSMEVEADDSDCCKHCTAISKSCKKFFDSPLF